MYLSRKLCSKLKMCEKNEVFGRFLTVLTPQKALMAIKLYQLININPLLLSYKNQSIDLQSNMRTIYHNENHYKNFRAF